MTRSDLPPGPEVPESTVSELQTLYREAAHAEPDAMLDRSILDAARAELRGAGETKARRQLPWWKRWLPAVSALAIALVGLSVTWRVMDQQERELRQEMKAAEGVREGSVAAAGSAAPAQRAADTPPVRDVAPVAEKSRRAESTGLKDAQPGVPEPAAMPAPATPMPMMPMVPAVADEALKKSGRADKEELRERRDANAATGAVSSPAAKSAVGSVALPPPDAATPEAWLKQVRDLRAAGRSAEAAQSLARFRARYPDFVLPDDLLNVK
jgi:hypothetical protein